MTAPEPQPSQHHSAQSESSAHDSEANTTEAARRADEQMLERSATHYAHLRSVRRTAMNRVLSSRSAITKSEARSIGEPTPTLKLQKARLEQQRRESTAADQAFNGFAAIYVPYTTSRLRADRMADFVQDAHARGDQKDIGYFHDEFVRAQADQTRAVENLRAHWAQQESNQAVPVPVAAPPAASGAITGRDVGSDAPVNAPQGQHRTQPPSVAPGQGTSLAASAHRDFTSTGAPSTTTPPARGHGDVEMAAAQLEPSHDTHHGAGRMPPVNDQSNRPDRQQQIEHLRAAESGEQDLLGDAESDVRMLVDRAMASEPETHRPFIGRLVRDALSKSWTSPPIREQATRFERKLVAKRHTYGIDVAEAQRNWARATLAHQALQQARSHWTDEGEPGQADPQQPPTPLRVLQRALDSAQRDADFLAVLVTDPGFRAVLLHDVDFHSVVAGDADLRGLLVRDSNLRGSVVRDSDLRGLLGHAEVRGLVRADPALRAQLLVAQNHDARLALLEPAYRQMTAQAQVQAHSNQHSRQPHAHAWSAESVESTMHLAAPPITPPHPQQETTGHHPRLGGGQPAAEQPRPPRGQQSSNDPYETWRLAREASVRFGSGAIAAVSHRNPPEQDQPRAAREGRSLTDRREIMRKAAEARARSQSTAGAIADDARVSEDSSPESFEHRAPVFDPRNSAGPTATPNEVGVNVMMVDRAATTPPRSLAHDDASRPQHNGDSTAGVTEAHRDNQAAHQHGGDVDMDAGDDGESELLGDAQPDARLELFRPQYLTAADLAAVLEGLAALPPATRGRRGTTVRVANSVGVDPEKFGAWVYANGSPRKPISSFLQMPQFAEHRHRIEQAFRDLDPHGVVERLSLPGDQTETGMTADILVGALTQLLKNPETPLVRISRQHGVPETTLGTYVLRRGGGLASTGPRLPNLRNYAEHRDAIADLLRRMGHDEQADALPPPGAMVSARMHIAAPSITPPHPQQETNRHHPRPGGVCRAPGRDRGLASQNGPRRAGRRVAATRRDGLRQDAHCRPVHHTAASSAGDQPTSPAARGRTTGRCTKKAAAWATILE